MSRERRSLPLDNLHEELYEEHWVSDEGLHEEQQLELHESLHGAQSVVHGTEWVYHKELHRVQLVLGREHEKVHVHVQHHNLQRVFEREYQCEMERRIERVTQSELEDETGSVQYELAYASEHDFYHELCRQGVFEWAFRGQYGQGEKVRALVPLAHDKTAVKHFDWAALRPSVLFHGSTWENAIGNEASNEEAQSPYVLDHGRG